jgi:inward rectifier potassium channel
MSGDLYHTLLSVGWGRFFGLLFALYLAVNSVFAWAYLLCGENALEGIPKLEAAGAFARFASAFFFSVQTFATIGYGRITPVGYAANVIVVIEALAGLLSVALATGLLFARFSRPTARVIFSEQAIIQNHDGRPSLLFRMGNERLNQIVEAKVTVTLVRNETTAEGTSYRTFHDMKLERANSPMFALSWLVVHPLDQESPLYGLTADDLIKMEAEILVSLTGIDDIFSQTINARYSYMPQEIVWNADFVDMLTRAPSGPILIDLSRIHDIVQR